ncbi:hypothetical protein [Providencia alcalifaciens]|nr:hypothetical protein [Providencia alcalifaciens]
MPINNLLAVSLVADTQFYIQSNTPYLGWLGLDNWYAALSRSD